MEECKYEIKSMKLRVLLMDDLSLSSFDESDNESDNESNNESDNDESND